ncbi:MAG: hypothetical protein NZM35_05010 [Chitinophagales bacterium]|nr:hypothetical protein [Chitinophagales bacterium]MDW8418582.1 hypothetical protein [Chitinophagales bacterium]
MKQKLLLFLNVALPALLFGANDTADTLFTSELKSYVAVGVVVIIFFIILIFLVWLEKRISKLEKK